MIRTIRQHLAKNLDYYLLALMATLGFYLDLSLKKIAFLVVIVWLILNPISARLAALLALLAAVGVAVLLLVRQPGLAEQLSIGLFMAFVYVVISLIVQAQRK